MLLLLAIKLCIASLCGALDGIGGLCWLPARRFIIPVVLCVSVSTLLHIWWIGLLVLPVIGTLVLGYKNFGSGKFSRGCWLFVQYVIVGLGLFLTGHLAWYFYFPYAVLGGVLGGTLISVEQFLGDFIDGLFLGCIIFLVR